MGINVRGNQCNRHWLFHRRGVLTVSKAILAQISYWATGVGRDAVKGTYRLHTVIPGSSHYLRVRNRVAAANIAWRKSMARSLYDGNGRRPFSCSHARMTRPPDSPQALRMSREAVSGSDDCWRERLACWADSVVPLGVLADGGVETLKVCTWNSRGLFASFSV